jgi:hypothetical protein
MRDFGTWFMSGFWFRLAAGCPDGWRTFYRLGYCVFAWEPGMYCLSLRMFWPTPVLLAERALGEPV